MKIFVLLLTFSCVCVTLSSGGEVSALADPKNPGVCIHDGKVLKKGINDVDDACIRFICHEDGSYVLQNCGTAKLEGCTEGDFVDVTRPYPECCKKNWNCKGENGDEIRQS